MCTSAATARRLFIGYIFMIFLEWANGFELSTPLPRSATTLRRRCKMDMESEEYSPWVLFATSSLPVLAAALGACDRGSQCGRGDQLDFQCDDGDALEAIDQCGSWGETVLTPSCKGAGRIAIWKVSHCTERPTVGEWMEKCGESISRSWSIVVVSSKRFRQMKTCRTSSPPWFYLHQSLLISAPPVRCVTLSQDSAFVLQSQDCRSRTDSLS